ncbi:MAG: hypothetical protein KAT32_04745 [Candidatus Moranbacteria bacterium]|nr:hypothetical protein [Candidatus Moranbacteria bacterium]
MKIIDQKRYDEMTKDGYLALDSTIQWAELMESRIKSGKSVSICAEETAKIVKLESLGYLSAMNLLVQTWKHRDALIL